MYLDLTLALTAFTDVLVYEGAVWTTWSTLSPSSSTPEGKKWEENKNNQSAKIKRKMKPQSTDWQPVVSLCQPNHGAKSRLTWPCGTALWTPSGVASIQNKNANFLFTLVCCVRAPCRRLFSDDFSLAFMAFSRHRSSATWSWRSRSFTFCCNW